MRAGIVGVCVPFDLAKVASDFRLHDVPFTKRLSPLDVARKLVTACQILELAGVLRDLYRHGPSAIVGSRAVMSPLCCGGLMLLPHYQSFHL